MSRWLIILLLLFVTPSWAGVDLAGDSSDDYISVPDLGITTQARTISAWVNAGTKDGIMNIFGWGANSSEAQCVVHFDVVAEADIYWAFNQNDYYTVGSILTRGTWHHVAVVYDGGTLSTSTVHIYVDGDSKSLTKAGSGSGSANTTDTLYRLGWDYGSDTTRTWDGKIEEFAVWNTNLSANEVTQLASSRVKRMPLQIQSSNLQVYYPLDEYTDLSALDTSANGYTDLSANGNHGQGVDSDGDSDNTAQEVLSYP